MRNGNRWRVDAVDVAHHRVAARRLDDGARAVFSGDYLREHVTYGYATTVHTAQGVTADATHTVLGASADRALLYVAMTRGRDTNTAYLYERQPEAAEHHAARSDAAAHVLTRGSGREAAALAYRITTNDQRARTAHDVAADTIREHLPAQVAELAARRAQRRLARYHRYHSRGTVQVERTREQHLSSARTSGFEL